MAQGPEQLCEQSAESAYGRVTGAPKQTARLGTARVWQGEFKGETTREEEAISAAEGRVDFARRWSRVEHRTTEADRELVRQLAERYPGVADEGEDDEPAVSLHDGARSLFGSSAGWTEFGDVRPEDPLHPGHPLWLLEVLGAVERNVRVLGAEAVRGMPTIHCACRLDIRDAVRRGVGWFPSEPRARGYWRALRVDAWLDDNGVIRRMGWISLPYLRRCFPGRFRPRPNWHVVELWDFGVEVEISVPSDVEHTRPQPLWKTAIELWRWGRDTRRGAREQD